MRFPARPVRALRAEVRLALLLVVRHRVPRLAAALVVGGWLLVGAGAARPLAAPMVVLGSLAVVAGSRPLARGRPLASARSAVRVTTAVAGRFLALLILLGPLAAVMVALGTGSGTPPPMAPFGAAVMLASALAAVSMGIAAWVGPGAAVTAGLLCVWVGAASPAAVDATTSGLPAGLGAVVQWSWHALPLSWRAVAWAGGMEPPPEVLPFAGWAAAGLAAAAAAVRPRQERGP